MKNPYSETEKMKKITPERLMLIFIIALLALGLAKREMTNLQLKNIPFVENHIAQDDFCKWSLQRMIEMTPVKETLTSDIFYIFKNNDNPLKLSQTDTIIFEKSVNDTCKFVVKAADGELKGFVFNLVSSVDKPFYFQIDNITNEVGSSELYEKSTEKKVSEE
jgi:hypothetical protein